MARLSSFHNPLGGSSSLGYRTKDHGIEIFFDDGVTRRMAWRVATPGVSEQRLGDALRAAIFHNRVVPALYSELRKRSIAVEPIRR